MFAKNVISIFKHPHRTLLFHIKVLMQVESNKKIGKLLFNELVQQCLTL